MSNLDTALAKLAAIEYWPKHNLIAPTPHMTPSEARALRERLEWRPIETAPKDGTFVLLITDSGHHQIGQYCQDQYWRQNLFHRTVGNLINWQPLPPPPAKEPT